MLGFRSLSSGVLGGGRIPSSAPAIITSTGVLEAQQATMSGTSEVERISTGTLAAQVATMSGVALREVTGAGTLLSTQATMNGQASSGAITSTGSLQASVAIMSGVSSTVPNFIDGVGSLVLSYRGQYYSGRVG